MKVRASVKRFVINARLLKDMALSVLFVKTQNINNVKVKESRFGTYRWS